MRVNDGELSANVARAGQKTPPVPPPGAPVLPPCMTECSGREPRSMHLGKTTLSGYFARMVDLTFPFRTFAFSSLRALAKSGEACRSRCDIMGGRGFGSFGGHLTFAYKVRMWDQSRLSSRARFSTFFSSMAHL